MPRPIALLALAVLLPLRPLASQGTDWTTIQQSAIWMSAFVEQPLSERVALWTDLHWRRMGLGAEPQQALGRAALLYTITPRLRVGAGYAYVGTAPYGESPGPSPTREQRAWQQVQLTQTAGDWGLSYRLRTEQRWTAAVTDGETGAYHYGQRLRLQARAQHPLAAMRFHSRPVQGFAYNEILIPVGHDDGAQRRLQNRLGLGVSLPINAEQRLDVGYLNLWNRLTPRRTHEINHTLHISYVFTGTFPQQGSSP